MINMRLCPAEAVYDPVTPLKLVAANGQQLYGGQKMVKLAMFFRQEYNGIIREEKLKISAEFYLADIKLDAILSYPWMRKHHLGVFPDLNALAMRDPFILLYGEEKLRKRFLSRETRIQTLTVEHCMSDLEDPGNELEGGSEPPTIPLWVLQTENWALPPQGKHEELRPKFLNPEEIEIFQEIFTKEEIFESPQDQATSSCYSIVTDGPEPYNDPCIERYIAKLHEEFDDIVLCTDIQPDPPVRGVYGWAYIPLKTDAQPEARKPIFMHGERLEAFKTVTENWINENLFELPTPGVPVSWMSRAFVVP